MADLRSSSGKKLKLEIVKSVAVLLLAVILLVGAIFAWFEGVQNEVYSVIDTSLGVEAPPLGDVGLGEEVIVERKIYLPCATKPISEDGSIDKYDFSRAVKCEVYNIVAEEDAFVIVSVLPKDDPESSRDDSEGLHYCVFSYDVSTTLPDAAEAIITEYNNDGCLHDKSHDPIRIFKGESIKVSILYWADYTDEYVETINKGESMTYMVEVNFSTELPGENTEGSSEETT